MAESPFNRPKPQFSRQAPAAAPRKAPKPDLTISCRATNPLSLQDDLQKVFLDENQAKATTATRLFRNEELFRALAKVVLPEFFAKNRTAKFCMWSTGCSSDEEVYSLAMIALNEFEKNRRPVQMEAFGTDINPQRIGEGRLGVYGRPSRDALTQQYWTLLNRYASMDAHEVHMGDVLRTVCKFTLFDMRKCPKKHTFHFIVCNHVLQYYDGAGQKHIISNLKTVLKPGGFLYLEGITEHGLEGSGLKKLPNAQNLFVIADESKAKFSSPLFRK